MALFDDVDGLLPGLLPAAWRGRRFWVINAEHSVGRRIHAQLFPGLDLKTHDDIGPLDGPIRMSGLVIGDDYVEQAKALEAAFRQAGPATLIHPWRGPLRCVLFRPARVEYDVKELRVARIDAEFDPTSAASPARVLSTLAGALGALLGLSTAARALVTSAVSATPLSLALYSRAIAATGNVVDVAETWANRSGRSAALLPAVVAARSAFSTAAASSSRAAAAPALAAVPPTLSNALAAVFKPQPAPGLGAGGELLPVIAPDPRAGAELLLTAAADLGRRLRPAEPAAVPGLPVLAAVPGASGTERSVLLAAEVGFVVDAARLVATIPFVSRQEAQAYAGRLDDELRRCGISAAALAKETAAPAGALWRALNESRARLAMDLSEAIGRLPAVRLVDVPGNASAIVLAQHLAGDDPAAVFPLVDDIVRRNRLRHPASLGAGPVEVLR